MKILSIETSSNICSVCVSEDNKIIKEISVSDLKTHSTVLMPTIEKILQETNLSLDVLDLLCCSIGPGSFTGIRIGISTIKAFSIVKKTPIVGVSSLLAMTYNIENFDGIVCPILDARNDNVYCGIYDKDHNPLEEDFSDHIDIIIERLKEYQKNILFIGDGSIVHKEKLKNAFPTSSFGSDNENLVNGIGIALRWI